MGQANLAIACVKLKCKLLMSPKCEVFHIPIPSFYLVASTYTDIRETFIKCYTKYKNNLTSITDLINFLMATNIGSSLTS